MPFAVLAAGNPTGKNQEMSGHMQLVDSREIFASGLRAVQTLQIKFPPPASP